MMGYKTAAGEDKPLFQFVPVSDFFFNLNINIFTRFQFKPKLAVPRYRRDVERVY